MSSVTLSHQPLDEILIQMHHATPIHQHKFWIPNSTQITKLYHKEELVEKGQSYTRGKDQQISVPYTEFCMGGKKVASMKGAKKSVSNSTQITKLYHKEELVEKGQSYTRGKDQQISVPYTEFCMAGKKLLV